MYCGTRSTAYWIRVLFSMAHRAPLKAAPQGVHQHTMRPSARRTGYACSSIRRTARLFKSPHKGCTGMFCNMKAYWMRVLFLTAHGHEHQHGILIRVLFSAAHCAPLNAAPQGRTAGAAARPAARHTRYACSSIRRIAHPCKPSHKGRSGVPCGMRLSTAYWIRVLFPTAHRAPL